MNTGPDPLRPPDCVVVTVDGSDTARRSVSVAVGLATRLDVPVGALVEHRRADPDEVIANWCRRVDGLVDGRDVAGANALRVSRDRRGPPPLAIDSPGEWTRTVDRVVVGSGVRSVSATTPERLAVALDGSVADDVTLRAAFDWASVLGLDVEVIAVVPDAPPSLRAPTDLSRAQRLAVDPEDYLETLATGRSATNARSLTVVRARIGMARALEHHLRHLDDTMLVLSDGRRRRRRLRPDRSSIAAVLRCSPVPVMLVANSGDTADDAAP